MSLVNVSGVCLTHRKINSSTTSLVAIHTVSFDYWHWNVIIRFAFHLSQSNGYHPHTSFAFQSLSEIFMCVRVLFSLVFFFFFFFLICFQFDVLFNRIYVSPAIFSLLRFLDFDSNHHSSVCYCGNGILV